uniref:Uncharacterized protein n=1 Tax=Romanomermis culicivorax TaxID=13658 RepID=A0A915HMX1_ROMCU
MYEPRQLLTVETVSPVKPMPGFVRPLAFSERGSRFVSQKSSDCSKSIYEKKAWGICMPLAVLEKC